MVARVKIFLVTRISGNKSVFFSFVLMDYFFRCQKITFNLENKKHICQGNFFVYHKTGSTYSRIIFRAMFISRIYTNIQRNWANAICIRVNIFAKSVKTNSIHGSIHKEKKKIIIAWILLLLRGKVNFSVIHPTHITIYSLWEQ